MTSTGVSGFSFGLSVFVGPVVVFLLPGIKGLMSQAQVLGPPGAAQKAVLGRSFYGAGQFTGRGNLPGGAIYRGGNLRGKPGSLRGDGLARFTGQSSDGPRAVCVCVLYIDGRAAETSEVPTSVCVCVYDFGCKSMERLVACLWKNLERASNKHKQNQTVPHPSLPHTPTHPHT